MRISDWTSDVCSSDLRDGVKIAVLCAAPQAHVLDREAQWDRARADLAEHAISIGEEAQRSEEHTSELQSLMRISYAVFCLKKKTNQESITPEIYSQHTASENNDQGQ